uniref:Uncharacterized protein n=1 Tax=Strigamia maritima TaxID=126957 RepID=T1IYS3_STRMM
MNYHTYTDPSPSYSDEDYGYYPVASYTFLESIIEETPDELSSETSDDEALSVIYNDFCAKTDSNYPDETKNDEQLDKWSGHSISLEERERCAVPAFDLDNKACFDEQTSLATQDEALDIHLENTTSSGQYFTKRSPSLEEFLLQEFEANNDCETMSVECFDGVVKCCHERSLTDFTPCQSKINDNLSEDSGFSDDKTGKKTSSIEVNLEEKSDYIYEAPPTTHDDSGSGVGLPLQKVWERSLESGRATTDDWLGLKMNSEKTMAKKGCSLLSLGLDNSSLNDHFSPPAERQSKEEARDQERSRIMSARTETRRSLVPSRSENAMQSSIAIALLPHHNGCHHVQRVNIEDDSNDYSAIRPLEDCYHRMERAIKYFQHQPPVNPSRNHIWNARQQFFDRAPDTPAQSSQRDAQTKALSMLSLNGQRVKHEKNNNNAERARSMEFIFDADNKVAAHPPENQLVHGDGRPLSEHELRVRSSLRQLNVPEWFNNSPYKRGKGFLLKKRNNDNDNAKRWQGLTSRTPSAPSISCRCSNEQAFSSRSLSLMTDKEIMRCQSDTAPTTLTKQPYLGWRSSAGPLRENSNAESNPTNTNTSSNFYRSRLSALWNRCEQTKL